jgi:hypothetical protein
MIVPKRSTVHVLFFAGYSIVTRCRRTEEEGGALNMSDSSPLGAHYIDKKFIRCKNSLHELK